MKRSRVQVVDELLVLAAQAGDASAFERLAVRWHPRLLRHARRLTGDAEGGKDSTQEAWVAIVRGLGRLQDPARFGPWALRITARRCAEWIGRRQQARTRTGAPEAMADLPSPADEHLGEVARVRDALRRLGPSDRVLMAMFYVEGLPVGDIALALDVPAGTVKSRLFHARERLRAVLGVSHDPEDRR